MPNKHDFCRNEQHPCPLPLWSGSDNLGAVESRLSREKNKSAHNLCILNAGRIYLWGLQATIYILVYVKDRKHKLVSGVADTAGRQEAAEGAGAGAQGQDEEINNPLIIQNSQWLQAIGKRFSNYLINCSCYTKKPLQDCTFFFFLPIAEWKKAAIFCEKLRAAGRWAVPRPWWAVILSKLEANGPFCCSYNSSWKYQLLRSTITQI